MKVPSIGVRGQCHYHWGQEVEDLRMVQLSHNTSHEKHWQDPIWICGSCRKYLNGMFRYIKGDK